MNPEEKRERLLKLELRIKRLIDNREGMDQHKYESMLDLYWNCYLDLKSKLENK